MIAFMKVAAKLLLAVVALWVTSFLALRMARNALYDESGTSSSLNVAGVAMTCDVEPAINRQRMLDAVRTVKAEHPDVDLIMFGEAITGWYSMGGETAAYHRKIAETIPGATTALMRDAAREHRVYLSFGLSEASAESVYNSQVLIDPAGSIVAVHRKVNLQGSRVFMPGVVPVTMADVKGVRTAIIICSDIQSSQVRKALRAGRPQLILGSLANASDPHWFVSGMIAKMCGSWILTANRYGPDGRQFFDGQMIVADPLGELRVKAKDSAQHITYEIRFDERRSAVRDALRSMYRYESLGIHLVTAISLLLPAIFR